MRRRRPVALVVGALLAVTGCTTAGIAAPGPAAATPETPRTPAPNTASSTGTTAPDLVATYGYAPDPQ